MNRLSKSIAICGSILLMGCSSSTNTEIQESEIQSSNLENETVENEQQKPDGWVIFGEPFKFITDELSETDFKNLDNEQRDEVVKDILNPLLVQLTGQYGNAENSKDSFLTLCYGGENKLFILPYSLMELSGMGVDCDVIVTKLNDTLGIDSETLKKDDRFTGYLYEYEQYLYENDVLYIRLKSPFSYTADDGETIITPVIDLGFNTKENLIGVRGMIPDYTACNVTTKEEFAKLTAEDSKWTQYNGMLFWSDMSKAREHIAKQEYEKKIASSEPWIGMTAEEVRKSKWGEPDDINTTITKYGTHEQWCYSGGRYVYLDDGIVTSIQK